MSFQYNMADPKNWSAKAAEMLKMPAEEFKMYILTMYDEIYSFDNNSKSEIMNKI